MFKLTGKMPHSDRVTHFKGFDGAKGGGVLFATGVASRGLDFAGVKWIVHFDLEMDVKAYVNRVGRTARLN